MTQNPSEHDGESPIQSAVPMRAAEDLDAAIYARTSSASQRFGYSLDEQVRQCWVQCERLDWDVTHVFRDEAESGNNTNRPMFQKMLAEAEEQTFDVVIFWKLDRFSRSLIHAVELERDFREWGVALFSVTEQIDTTTPTGRFNFRNISSASEFERDLIKQRSQMGMRALAMEHKWPNDHPPLGYRKRDDDKLEPLPSEADLVREMFQRYCQVRSMPKLAKKLNAEGKTAKSGEDWTPQKISAVLRNELYTGEYSVADVNEHVPEYQILDKELFEDVADVRMRFQSSQTQSVDEMSKERKKDRVSEVLEQYDQYLTESEGPL